MCMQEHDFRCFREKVAWLWQSDTNKRLLAATTRSLLSQPTGPSDDLECLGYTLLEVRFPMLARSSQEIRQIPDDCLLPALHADHVAQIRTCVTCIHSMCIVR